MEEEFLFDTEEYLGEISSPKTIKKIFKNLERLTTEGHQKLMPPQIVKKMKTNYELFELRTIFNDILYRLLFIIKNNKYSFIIGFTKKVGEKTPQKYIDTAIDRLKKL